MSGSSTPIEIFFSYAPRDEPLLRELEQYLSPLRQQGLITTWHDREVRAGENWEEAINHHLTTAAIILLLISADFLASDYCIGIEMHRALQRQRDNEAYVIPILLRPVAWQGILFAHLPVLPTNARPVTMWRNRSEAFADVAAGIRRVVEDLALSRTSDRSAVLPSIPNIPVEIFFSYAYQDEPLLRELEQHLSPLLSQGLITMWQDRKILAGEDWEEAINHHLATAAIILLLISADFLASDYCSGIEMHCALQRQRANEARVIPILLDPVNWQNTPFAHLPVLPTNALPVMMWQDREEAFVEVAAGIRRVVEDLALSRISGRNAVSSPILNVPYAHNPHFTGREDILNQLEHSLSSGTPHGEALIQPHALIGSSGIGKTAIAIEYTYRSQGRYTYIFWVHASTIETTIAGFATIASLLPSFPEQNDTDQVLLAKAVIRWLEQCEQSWLLIFDDVEDPSLVHTYLPQKGNGCILLTTRALSVSSLAISLEVEAMGFVESTQFLLRRAQRGDQASDDEINQAGNVVIALGFLPLALDQAGAYIEETGCSFADYLHRYQTRSQELLAQRGSSVSHYPDSVATTWLTSFQKIEQAHPAAAELLRLCAFLAPAAIPEEVFLAGAHYLGSTLWPVAADPVLFNQAVDSLLAYSLLRRNSQERTLTVHRLVQVIVGNSLSPEARNLWKLRAVLALDAAFPEVVLENWPICDRLLAHAQICAPWVDQPPFATLQAARLLNQVALYLKIRALYAVAEPCYQRALNIYEQVVGHLHPNTATVQSNLALLYVEQGRYSQAEPLFHQALRVHEQIFGTGHPSTAASLDNLANLYVHEGKYEQAEPLFQRALAIREQQLGPMDPSTATSLNNLAALSIQQGRYSEAESFYQRALTLCEQMLGQEHPHTQKARKGYEWLLQRREQSEERLERER